ncbi:LpxI family protein [Yoonia sp. 208BN28-4]|uniref:LpxI family protein n=1 Tax=Yoonia sp. 208BN28-4 TaxID=3126505 RepID=UPI0030983B5E
MLALVAGTGGLPAALVARLPEKPYICALDGHAPDLSVDLSFRIEHLGTTLDILRRVGVTRVCFAGAVRRPDVDPRAVDAATAPLVPRIAQAIAQGDDGALRIIIAIFEERGIKVVAAHDIAPDLIPQAGVLTRAKPQAWHEADARAGAACVAQIGAADQGQACIVRVGRVEATEDAAGTEAMIAQFYEPYARRDVIDPLGYAMDVAGDALDAVSDWLSGTEEPPLTADDGILYKAPKPGQDRRADLPLIGPDTVMQAAEAGLAGIVIAAGGVMVLDQPTVIEMLDAQGMFLWVREDGS